MKPSTPHDPRNEQLDDLIAAALHGELTPGERIQFDVRLSNDPAAQAAYRKAQLMHDLLEKTHKNAQPDPAFEQRMVSGVRRKIQQDQRRETAWESLLVLWTSVKGFMPRRYVTQYAIMLAFVSVVSISVLFETGNQVKSVFTTISSQLSYAGSAGEPSSQALAYAAADQAATAATKRPTSIITNGIYPRTTDKSDDRVVDLQKAIHDQGINYTETAQKGVTLSGYADTSYTKPFAGAGQAAPMDRNGFASGSHTSTSPDGLANGIADANGGVVNAAQPMAQPMTMQAPASTPVPTTTSAPAQVAMNLPDASVRRDEADKDEEKQRQVADSSALDDLKKTLPKAKAIAETELASAPSTPAPAPQPVPGNVDALGAVPAAPAIDTRKLIRSAQLDLEVKSYQVALDAITALTKSAGGYVDTSNSQKGGNGKLQGTVVVKVLPQNLDSFLLKLRDLGELQNQSVSTDDVTKDYFDTQARLDNSRRMEAQLQDLLKKTNGKVSELLQVERELGRVRGDIEQMQGQLKLYDFQVQFATITIQMREKDLNQTAAYLLKEQDQFSLFATDVEGTFQEARHTADQFKAQILAANLNHESGSNVSAELTIMVAPDQIEAFLTQLRGLGRVANFTRQTQRVAKDGGDSDQPADQTLTEKDKVQVGISIRSDDESRKQVAMTVVTPAVDTALDQAKAAALANDGAEILNSSLNKSAQGQSSAQLTVRVPGKYYHQLLDTYRTIGRTASFSLQRDDNSGPGANGDDAPVIVSLSLTDTDTPLQVTQMSVQATDVDNQAQQLKRDAAAAGVQVTGSNFQRDPNGMEIAQMTFRLPMSKYASFVETLKKLGHVETLTVQRQDRPDQTLTDDTAPVEIGLRMHNQGDIVAEDTGLWATLRQTFGEGAGALFGSIRVIGVLVAFSVPWIFAIGLIAWIGRRIYVWRRSK